MERGTEKGAVLLKDDTHGSRGNQEPQHSIVDYIPEPTDDQGFLPSAVGFARLGRFGIFPAEPFGNRPHRRLLGSFGHFESIATTDEALIRHWWQIDKASNIGIATGAPSRLLVIDYDRRHGVDGLHSLMRWADENGHEIPRGVRVDTPGDGGHLYFTLEEPLRSCAGWLPNVDVRADGGMVVAPPSVRTVSMPSSASRTPDTGYRQYEVGRGSLTALPPAPDWLVAAIRRDGGRYRPGGSGTAQMASGLLISTQDALREGLPVGRRNDSMHRLICRWWAKYGTDSEREVYALARSVWLMTPDHATFPWAEVESMMHRNRTFIAQENTRRINLAARLMGRPR